MSLPLATTSQPESISIADGMLNQSLVTQDDVTTDELARQIQACASKRLTGRLEVEAPQIQQWSLDFHLGHLTGCMSSVHPSRHWCRQMAQQCPSLVNDAGDWGSEWHQC